MEATSRNGPVVYIASAFSGDVVGNTKRTMGYSQIAIKKGAVPINPILNLLGVLNEESDREAAMQIDLTLLGRVDELWVFGAPTEGMKREIAEAKRKGIKTVYFEGQHDLPDGGTK